ncbi:MAG: cell division ATP-binding protein FtsE [Pseudomonadaceae bacterium]|nr:cell division ATP-binding protein FtsE [Pseudomonadaceae bacterium]
MTHIEFDRVVKRFDSGLEALANVSVSFEEGTMCFLTGHSGAGKSTFLKLLLRLDAPSRGQIRVNGVDLGGLSDRQLPSYRQHLGTVFQDHHLLAHRTVLENVSLPLWVTGMSERDIARRARAALSRVGLLDRERQLPQALSTGEQQRVGIARAVVNRPKILLADEPTGNLDPALSRDIMALFEQFNQVGTTVIVASHDIDLINSLGHRVLRLDHGQLAEDRPSRAQFEEGSEQEQQAAPE